MSWIAGISRSGYWRFHGIELVPTRTGASGATDDHLQSLTACSHHCFYCFSETLSKRVYACWRNSWLDILFVVFLRQMPSLQSDSTWSVTRSYGWFILIYTILYWFYTDHTLVYLLVYQSTCLLVMVTPLVIDWCWDGDFFRLNHLVARDQCWARASDLGSLGGASQQRHGLFGVNNAHKSLDFYGEEKTEKTEFCPKNSPTRNMKWSIKKSRACFQLRNWMRGVASYSWNCK